MFEELVRAAAVGFGILFIFLPIFIVYGVTRETSLLLFYISPLGAIAMVLLTEKKIHMSGHTEIQENSDIDELEPEIDIPSNGYVKIDLKDGTEYDGFLRKVSNDTYSLKIKTNDNETLLFIQKGEIKNVQRILKT